MRKLIMTLICFLCLNSAAMAGITVIQKEILLSTGIRALFREIHLTWLPNSEPDLSHYIVYWGTASRVYSFNSGNIGLVTEYIFNIPDDGQIYFFAVTAVDTAGLESDYSNEKNSQSNPLSSAGPDITVDAGALVMLDGSGSHPQEGEITNYTWSQTTGPTLTITNANQVQASVIIPSNAVANTVYTFKLVVKDADGDENSDTRTITVTPTQTIPLPGAPSSITITAVN